MNQNPQPEIVRLAHLSPCKEFRYMLARSWTTDPFHYSPMRVVMLNPSTADATKDDATIKRLIKRAQVLGHGGLLVFNLYAFRATDPTLLQHRWASMQPIIGEENHSWLRGCAEGGSVVVAWGAHPMASKRDRIVLDLFYSYNCDVQCFGITKDGFPLHPLHLAYSVPLRKYQGRFAR